MHRYIAGLEPEKVSNTLLRLHPGSLAKYAGEEILSRGTRLDIDLTKSGVNGLDAGYFEHGKDYFVYILKDCATGEMAAVLSNSITYTGVAVPYGYEMFRKLPWGFVFRTDWGGIPSFHISAWPKPFTRLTGASTGGLYQVLDGTATTWTNFSLASIIPDNCRLANIMVHVNAVGTAGSAKIKTPGLVQELMVGSANPVSTVQAWQTFDIRINSTRELQYLVTGGAVLKVFVLGYWSTEPS